MSRKIRFVTTFSAEGYEIYGEQMLRTFAKYGIGDLTVYSEDTLPALPRGVEFRDANAIPGFAEFIERHKDNPEARGLVEHRSWRKKEKHKGHSFRTDAFKFFRKPMVIEHMAQSLGDERCGLIWLDGDVVVRGTPPRDWWENVIWRDGDICYLGREGYHSECGFLLFSMPRSLEFIQAWARWYHTDAFLGRESHDSKLFDDTRFAWQNAPLVFRNISRQNRDTGHVFNKSALHLYFRHNKGQEKYHAADRSMVVPR